MKASFVAVLVVLAVLGASAQVDHRGQPAYDPYTPFYHAQAGGIFAHPYLPHPVGPWASPYNLPTTSGAKGPAHVGLHFHAPTAYPYLHPYYPAPIAPVLPHPAAYTAVAAGHAAAYHAAAAIAHAHAAAGAAAVANHAGAVAASWPYAYNPYYAPIPAVPAAAPATAPAAGGNDADAGEANLATSSSRSRASRAYNPEPTIPGAHSVYGQTNTNAQTGMAPTTPYKPGNVANPLAYRPIPSAGQPHFDTTQRIPLGEAAGDVQQQPGAVNAPAGPATSIPTMSQAELQKRGGVPTNSNVPDPKVNPLTTQPQQAQNRAPGTAAPAAAAPAPVDASNGPSAAANAVAQASANNQFNPRANYANGQLYSENGAMPMQDPLPRGPYGYWAKPSNANPKPGYVNDAYYQSHPFYNKFAAPAGPQTQNNDLPPAANAPAEAPVANPNGPAAPKLGKIAGQPEKAPAGVPAPPPPPPAPVAKNPLSGPPGSESTSGSEAAAEYSSDDSASSSSTSSSSAAAAADDSQPSPEDALGPNAHAPTAAAPAESSSESSGSASSAQGSGLDA